MRSGITFAAAITPVRSVRRPEPLRPARPPAGVNHRQRRPVELHNIRMLYVPGMPVLKLLELAAQMRPFLPLIVVGSLLASCADHGNEKDIPDSALYVRFTQARDSVMVGDPWGDATRRLEEQLGPAAVKTDTHWRWTTLQGDECFDLSVMRTGAVDNIERITNTYATSDVADEFARCRALVQPSNAP